MKIHTETESLSELEKNVVRHWKENSIPTLLEALTDYVEKHEIDEEVLSIKGVLSPAFKDSLFVEAESLSLIKKSEKSEVEKLDL